LLSPRSWTSTSRPRHLADFATRNGSQVARVQCEGASSRTASFPCARYRSVAISSVAALASARLRSKP
jgi:hypothetical protein